MLTSSLPNVWLLTWLRESDYGPLLVASLLSLSVGLFSIRLAKSKGERDTNPKLRELNGPDGEIMSRLVVELWQGIAGARLPLPKVRWFSSMDIAAYAETSNGVSEIHVSAGMWRAVSRELPAARVILAHEIAHLWFGDPQLLRLLGNILVATRSILLLASSAGVLTLIYVLQDLSVQAIQSGASIAAFSILWIRVGIAALSVLVLAPLCWVTIRRQIAYIVSLIEVRADVAAASWTNGLENFAHALAAYENVRRTNQWDLVRAMFSLNFTHIPERERLGILREPLNIATPKIRFFAFSVALVFLLPINFATPLLLGGSVNYIATLSMAMAVNGSIVAMLLIAGPDIWKGRDLPVGRMLILAGTSCIATALPCINLEPISYFVMAWSVGFGGHPMDFQQLPNDLFVTYQDIEKRFVMALFQPLVGLAFVANCLMLKFIVFLSNFVPGNWSSGRIAGPLILTCVFTAIAGIDSRMPMPQALSSWFVAQFANSGLGRAAFTCLPLLAAAIGCFLVQMVWCANKVWSRFK